MKRCVDNVQERCIHEFAYAEQMQRSWDTLSWDALSWDARLLLLMIIVTAVMINGDDDACRDDGGGGDGSVMRTWCDEQAMRRGKRERDRGADTEEAYHYVLAKSHRSGHHSAVKLFKVPREAFES